MTILIGNVIAERGLRIGDVSKLRQEFVLRFLRWRTYFDSRRPLDQRAARESGEGPVAIQESSQREHPKILIKLYVSPSSCREQF